MWDLENQTPFAAERAWVRDRAGAEVWLVAVKATFDIRADGSTEVAEEQPPVLRVPKYHGEAGTSSIEHDADLVLMKRTTDILVLGHAWAPEGRPVTRLDVGFRVGAVSKVLRVTGDRVWKSFGPSEPAPFLKMPLVYERAFGGVDTESKHPERDWDWRNPVGAGFCVAASNATGRALPNIEYPDDPLTRKCGRPSPAGFGPLCSHWQPRAGFAGTYDERWTRERKPLLPEDFDDRFFQCAPADQQAPQFLRGGEPVSLVHLAPQATLKFTLPALHLGFETRFSDGSREIHKTRTLHSVILEPDYPRVSLVWHTALPCHFKVQRLLKTTITRKSYLAGKSHGKPTVAEV